MLRIVLSTAFALAMARPAMAGIVVAGKVSQNGGQAPLTQFYQGDNARLELQPNVKTPSSFVLYRGGTISVVDGGKKAYLELQDRDVQVLGGILGAIPFKGPGGKPFEKPLTPQEVSFQKEAGDHKTGNWTCTRYTVNARGKKSGRICVVPMEKVGAKADDFKSLAALARSFSALGRFVPPQTAFLGWGLDRTLTLGFTVEAIGYDPQGKENSRMLVDTVKTEPLKDGVFTAPKGFAKRDFTAMLNNLATGKPAF